MKLNQCRYSKYIDEAGYATRLKFIFKFVIMITIIWIICSNTIVEVAFCDNIENLKNTINLINNGMTYFTPEIIELLKSKAWFLRGQSFEIKSLYLSLNHYNGLIPIDIHESTQIDIMNDNIFNHWSDFDNLSISEINTYKLVYYEAVGLQIDYVSINMNSFYCDPQYIFPMKKW